MTSQPAQILLIDDRPEIESALSTCLRKDPIQIIAARDGRAGVELALEKRFDLILLDVEMPEMDGFEVLQRLKNTEFTKAVPIIMVSGYDTLPDKVRSFELGATDYIVKPFQSAELRARVRAILRAQQLNRLLARAEKELGDARRALEEALGAKDRVIEVVAECLRAPLAGNHALADVLVQYGLGEPLNELARTLRANNDCALESLGDIMDLAALQHGRMALEPHPFDLRGCVEETLDSLAPLAAEKGLDLAGLLPADLPLKVVGDAKRVRQMLTRLVESAIGRASQGEIVLQVEREVAAATPLFHFQIKDSGPALSTETLERLFTPFGAPTEGGGARTQGRELGFAICQRLASLQGGRIWLETAAGTTVHLVLDLPLDAEAPAAGVISLPGRAAGLTVLVAGGSAAVCLALGQQAQALDLKPAMVASRRELLDYFQRGDPCDLLVLDAELPEGGGRAACQEIQRLGLATPPRIILSSRRGQPLPVQELEAVGVAAALALPATLASLRETVLRAWEGRPFIEEPPKLAALKPALAAQMPARILVVAGDTVTQAVLKSILLGFGYWAELARGAAEARANLKNETPFGIIFLDADLEGLDPIETTRQLRARERARAREHPEIPPSILIALSGREEARDGYLSGGMDDFLAKPPSVEAVLNLLENWAPMVPCTDAPVPPVPVAVTAAIQPSARPAPRPEAAPAVSALKLANEPVAPPLPASEPAPAPRAGLAPDAVEPPVDFEMLMEEAEGDWHGLFELIDLYLDQTEHRFEQLITAMSLGNAKEIEELARSGAGASRTCGITSLIKPLADMENLARAGNLEGVEIACSEAIQEYERLRAYLDRQRKLHLVQKE